MILGIFFIFTYNEISFFKDKCIHLVVRTYDLADHEEEAEDAGSDQFALRLLVDACRLLVLRVTMCP